MSSRWLDAGFKVMSAVAMLCPVLALLLLPATGSFPGRLVGSLLFVIVCAEKIWAMYFRMRNRAAAALENDWTALTVGIAYTAVMYGTIVEFYARKAGLAGAPGLWVGGAAYVAALAVRYWAFRMLGHQWAVHVDQDPGRRTLIRQGPYRWIRHPLYLGACLEVIGVPLFFGAPWTLLFAVVVFIPLEVQRAYFEERYLRRIFGGDYDRYAEEVWAFLPLPFGKKSAGPVGEQDRG